MAKQLQLRRGTTAQHSTFTGAVGEVTIDIDKDVVVVHDGATVGGFPSQKELVSGTNIKTVNSTTILGSGNISVQPTLESGTNIKTINNASILGSGNLNVISAGIITGGTTNQVLAKNSNTDYDTKWYSVQDTLISGTNIKTVNSTSLLGSGDVPIYTGFKNRIINGDMRIDQRNAGAMVTPSNSQYTLDRWNCLFTQASAVSVQQNAGTVSPPTGFTNYLGATSLSVTSLGSSDRFVIQQSIEGYNSADFNWGTSNAKSITVSFWVRSSLTGTFGGVIIGGVGPASYPFDYSISAANTWQFISFSVPGPTFDTWGKTNDAGLSIRFSLGCGTGKSGTAGAWAESTNVSSATGATSVVGTSGATFYITGVQLEKGSTATSFDYRPYGTELALCQRYYETGGRAGWVGYSGGASSTPNGWVYYKATKRAAATISVSSWALSSATATAYSASTDAWEVSVTTTSASNQAYAIASSWAASSEL